jgi:3-dehydroquinate synthase
MVTRSENSSRSNGRVTVDSSRNDDLGYPIVVGEGVAAQLAAALEKCPRPSVVLCDANPHVRAVADDAAAALGRGAVVLAFRLGERRKRLATVERVLDALLAANVERNALVLGVGGGVASDLFGFACAIYMRGIAYAHVATSLVAMVDAAVGGKTGVDLGGGKNLAGCFRDPVGVVCDVRTLATLPQRAMREGLAEIVKASIIEGGELFDAMEELAPHSLASWPWTDVIAAAIKVKTMTVADDRLESGAREVLNLGHTFAHAIELASDYTIPHGAAVALGLRAAGLLALRAGRFSQSEHLRVLAVLALLRLPLQTSLAPEAIWAAMRSDKKRRNGRLRFVLPRAIGDVEYGIECSPSAVRAVLGRLHAPPEKFRARR